MNAYYKFEYMNKIINFKSISLLIFTIISSVVFQIEAKIAGDWEYDDNTIIKYLGNARSVTVPSLIDGEAVTILGEYAFASAPDVADVTISEGIEELADDCLSGIRDLQSLTLPSTVKRVYAVYGGLPIPVINSPSLTAWLSIDVKGRMAYMTDLYIGGQLFTTFIADEDTARSLKSRAFYGVSSLKTAILDGVNEIPEFAFSSSGLEGVGFGEDVRSIGRRAFAFCNLQEILLPASLIEVGTEAFLGNTNVRRIVLGEGLKTIGAGAFYDTEFYGSIFSDAVNPPSATDAFDNGTLAVATLYVPFQSMADYRSFWKFTNIYAQVDDSEWEFSDGIITAYKGSDNVVQIPEFIGSYEVTGIGKGAFRDNTLISSVSIPNCAGYIEAEAFKGCTSLSEISLGSGISIIGKSAFEGCVMLKKVVLPSKLYEIGANAFASSGLKTLYLSSPTLTIGDDAFIDCNIENVHCSTCDDWLNIYFSTLASNPIHADGRLLINGSDLKSLSTANAQYVRQYAFYGLHSLTSVNLPKVVSIDRYAFQGCDNLKDLRLGDELSTIWHWAFSGCPIEGDLSFGESLRLIGTYAFSNKEGAPGLTTVTLGSNVNTIWIGAFAGHDNISKITCNAVIPPHLAQPLRLYDDIMIFSDMVKQNAPLYVPSGTASEYELAWSFPGDHIHEVADGGVLNVKLPDGARMSLISPAYGTRLHLAPMEPGWKLSAVYLNDEDIYGYFGYVTENGYWIIRDLPEGEWDLTVVLEKELDTATPEVTDESNPIKISVYGGNVTISGANPDSEVRVYDTAGNLLIRTTSHSFQLDRKGIMILTVGRHTYKFLN